MPKEWVFTFGYGQIPGAKYFTVVQADSRVEAIATMQKRTRKYAFVYSSREEAGVDRFNLQEIYWDPEFCGWSEHPVEGE